MRNKRTIYAFFSFSKLKLNDTEGAMKDVNHSLDINPSNSYAYKIRALIFLELNQTKNACKDLYTAQKNGYTRQYGQEVNELIEKHCR